MRIIFMGTPDFAVPALRALAAAHEVVAVYTQPPRAAGRRGRALTPTPVQLAAEALHIAVRQPTNFREEATRAEFAGVDANIAVVAAYGLILPRAVLAAPQLGCLNIHASLLPRWRGAAPVQRAMLAGDTDTGVTIMRMEAGLDTGPMLADARTAIGADDTAGSLTARLAKMGAALIGEVLRDLSAFAEVPQPADGITYAAKLDKAEARLDFTADAGAVLRQVRAFNPAPGAWFEVAGERCKLLLAEPAEGSGPPGMVLDEAMTIACGSGAIQPVLIQRAGRPAMATAEMLRGLAVPKGTRLG